MALFFYKEKNKDIQAAAYLRLSIEDGDKAESNSIGNQRELIRDFAAERPGLHLVEEYADDGYTGTNFERPGFKRMMEDIKSGKINCIIVKDLSRLGRNYIEMGKYLEQIFPMMGIRFIAINDNYDNANTESSDSDSIVVPFKNLLNDSYCRDISIKVRSQLDMKRRKGEFIGGYAIYGYCKDKRNKNRLVVDEYAADIVRSIYRRKLEGMSAQAIAEQLNSENVLAPSEYKRLCGLNYHSGFKAGTHAKWQAIQVLRILKNEIYTGTMVQGRRQKINYKIKKIRDVEESGWIRVPNMHEAIIPQKLFDTVQEVLKLDTCASKGQQTVNLFSGIVRCGGCGQNMVRRTVSKNGKKYIYLHCVTNHNGLGCSSHLISESKLEEVVLAALQGKIQQISGLEHRLDEINEIPKNERRLKSVEEHLKILDKNRAVFQTVRAKSEQIRSEYQNDLAGMVFCADCGRPMEFERLPHGAEESKKVCYYICKARQADDKCIGHQIPEKLLKALIMDQLHLLIVQLSDKRKVLEELQKIEDVQNPVYRAKGEIMSLTDKVSQMAKKREQLYADYVAGVVDSEDYQLIREDYSRQYDGLRAALQEAESKKTEVERQIEEYLNMTSHLEEHLDNFEFDIQLVKSLVQKIEVSADKRIRIVFGFRDVFTELGKESAET